MDRALITTAANHRPTAATPPHTFKTPATHTPPITATPRRPELLSAVMLRQNPHNVAEWHKRVKLFEGHPTKQILTYTEAVKTVDIAKALGKPHSLWCAFAKFYERHGDLPNARIIFQKAVQVRGGWVGLGGG